MRDRDIIFERFNEILTGEDYEWVRNRTLNIYESLIEHLDETVEYYLNEFGGGIIEVLYDLDGEVFALPVLKFYIARNGKLYGYVDDPETLITDDIDFTCVLRNVDEWFGEYSSTFDEMLDEALELTGMYKKYAGVKDENFEVDEKDVECVKKALEILFDAYVIDRLIGIFELDSDYCDFNSFITEESREEFVNWLRRQRARVLGKIKGLECVN